MICVSVTQRRDNIRRDTEAYRHISCSFMRFDFISALRAFQYSKLTHFRTLENVLLIHKRSVLSGFFAHRGQLFQRPFYRLKVLQPSLHRRGL